MSYSEDVADRVRETFGNRRRVVEKKMFGGLTFMLNGHMCCGVVGDELMVRVGPDRYEAAVKRKHAREMAAASRHGIRCEGRFSDQAGSQ